VTMYRGEVQKAPAQAAPSQCQRIQEEEKAVGEVQEQEAYDDATEAKAEVEKERRRRRRRQQWDALHENEPGGRVAQQRTRRGCSHGGKKAVGRHVAAPDREQWWWQQQRTETRR
jgi:hypothetical protein